MLDSVINGRYRIECELGSGGMADVYKAFDIVEKMFVALKIIKAEYCADPGYVARFEKEADTVLSLKCKNIACAYDYGKYTDENGAERSYIALEYVEGCTLKDSLNEHGAISPRMAAGITMSVLDALECAHNSGYIHRDVKPQNILISTDKTVKLSDFGIAKESVSDAENYEGRDIIGSVHYISPEQANKGVANEKSDIYSTGIMLYEMLVGHPPFDGDSAMQVAMQHITGTITPPMELNPSVPPALNDVVLKATAKNPEDRYMSAADMKKDISKAMFHPNKRLLPISRDDETKSGKQGKGRAKLWHLVLPISAAIVIIVGVFLLWYFLSAKDSIGRGYARVPELCGKNQAQAEQLLSQRDLELIVLGTAYSDEYPEGTICFQDPADGKLLTKGEAVGVLISNGSDTVIVVNLYGMTLEEAENALDSIGMKLGDVTYIDSDAPSGTVVGQSIAADQEAVRGDEIDVEVSNLGRNGE